MSYNVTEIVFVEIDPIAKFRSALKYTSAKRVKKALDHMVENKSVEVDTLAGFFLAGRRSSDAILALKSTQGVVFGPRTGNAYLTRRAKRRIVRQLAAELVMKNSRGTLKSAPAEVSELVAA